MLDPCSRLFKKVNADFARRHIYIYIYSWNRLIKTTRSMDQPMEDRLEPSKYPIHAYVNLHAYIHVYVHAYINTRIEVYVDVCMHPFVHPSAILSHTHIHM